MKAEPGDGLNLYALELKHFGPGLTCEKCGVYKGQIHDPVCPLVVETLELEIQPEDDDDCET